VDTLLGSLDALRIWLDTLRFVGHFGDLVGHSTWFVGHFEDLVGHFTGFVGI